MFLLWCECDQPEHTWKGYTYYTSRKTTKFQPVAEWPVLKAPWTTCRPQLPMSRICWLSLQLSSSLIKGSKKPKFTFGPPIDTCSILWFMSSVTFLKASVKSSEQVWPRKHEVRYRVFTVASVESQYLTSTSNRSFYATLFSDSSNATAMCGASVTAVRAASFGKMARCHDRQYIQLCLFQIAFSWQLHRTGTSTERVAPMIPQNGGMLRMRESLQHSCTTWSRPPQYLSSIESHVPRWVQEPM